MSPPFRISSCTSRALLLVMACFVPTIQGGCEFPKIWAGRWFQSGVPNPLMINLTNIETKGECYEEQGDKYLIYDKSDNCYRCMVIHDKHPSVLQYKETFCEEKASLHDSCFGITGDAPLYSMFRKYPEAKPIACPFKSAPFTFSYNRGTGDCSNPPSKAESCTDDSRLVLKYQACPDVSSTESNVEELVCLATWKEGSTRYLIGKISQGNRRSLTSDEDQYRCFIYQRGSEEGRVVYHVAQSGDATCNGLQNAFEGSRTMKLTTVDNHHNRCKFPSWITDHHTWLSLDHRKTYKFSQKSATLKILDDEPKLNRNNHQSYAQSFGFEEFGFQSSDHRREQNAEMRVVCHGILQSIEERKVQIVAHITAGCDSGYVCMVFHKRDSNVIEIQQSEKYEENPDDACRYFEPNTPYTTLITPTLHHKRCPNVGRFTVVNSGLGLERRKKRQQPVNNLGQVPPPECPSNDYDALATGCADWHSMEFKRSCPQHPVDAYTCHGSWHENDTYYVIASPVSRKSTDPLRYCFIYTLSGQATSIGDGATGKASTTSASPGQTLRLSGVMDNCHRHIEPGVTGSWAFNFTVNGTCAESESVSSAPIVVPTILVALATLLVALLVR